MPAVPVIGIALGATGVLAAAGTAIAASIGFATVSAATATAIGSAAFAGAATLASGGSASQALRNAVVGGVAGVAGGYVGDVVGTAVGQATGSTVASNVAASAASAGVRAGVTGQDIGSALLGGAVGAGINAAVGEFDLPPAIHGAASSALRAAYSGQDIPQAIFGSFAGYAAKELGKDFKEQFSNAYNSLAENFQQQTAAVDSYNNLVSEFKDWDAGYQTRLADFNQIRDLHAAAEEDLYVDYGDGLQRRLVWAFNGDGDLVPSVTYNEDGDAVPVYAQNPYEEQFQKTLRETNDYVARYNEVWEEKSPMLDELKASITKLQIEGEGLSEQYDELHDDAVKTFEDLAVKFRDEQVEPEPTPEPVYEEEVVPEPVYEEEVAPEPVYEEEVVPEPVYEEEVAPEPVYEEEVVPEPVYEEEVAPEPDDEQWYAADQDDQEMLPTEEEISWYPGDQDDVDMLPPEDDFPPDQTDDQTDREVPPPAVTPPAVTPPVTAPTTTAPPATRPPAQNASQTDGTFDMLMGALLASQMGQQPQTAQPPPYQYAQISNPVASPYGGPSLFASGGSVPNMYAINEELLRILRG